MNFFIDSEKFVYKSEIISKTDTFLNEYKKIVNFLNYPEKIHNDKWKLSPFLYKGKWFNRHPAQKSLEFLKTLEHMFIATYSVFEPNAKIYPHVGYDLEEPVYRVHLPIIVPNDSQNCWIKVKGEKRSWQKNELLIFDDMMEHEAQNNTEEDRVVVIMDFKKEAFNL
tara:strand:+ start:17673 stop:18173 length:501 start_codon:yes stop_codon:yes gene_type:complete